MTYSLKDIYGVGKNMTTTEKTIVENEEQESYVDSETVTTKDVRKVVDKNLILGSVLMLVGLLVLMHFLD